MNGSPIIHHISQEQIMNIYRVEDNQSKGMYRSNRNSTALELMTGFDQRHPTPYADMKLREPWEALEFDDRCKMFFGFSSLDQLKFWIYLEDWRKLLYQEGFFISVYESKPEHTIIGETQAVFVKESATKIQQLSLLEI